VCFGSFASLLTYLSMLSGLSRTCNSKLRTPRQALFEARFRSLNHLRAARSIDNDPWRCELTSAFGGTADLAGLATGSLLPKATPTCLKSSTVGVRTLSLRAAWRTFKEGVCAESYFVARVAHNTSKGVRLALTRLYLPVLVLAGAKLASG
jgi:hypothetical protein